MICFLSKSYKFKMHGAAQSSVKCVLMLELSIKGYNGLWGQLLYCILRMLPPLQKTTPVHGPIY